MKNFFEALHKSGLFHSIADGEAQKMLDCLGAQTKNIRRGDAVLLAGDKPRHVGIVLAGQFHIAREDVDGARALIAALETGDIFAEALCCAHVDESPVTVFAGSDGAVLLLEFERILRTCGNSCPFHSRLIENMLGLIARKNLALQRRMDIISRRSIRERVLRYLEPLAKKRGAQVRIPWTREQLADFLCVERTALSHELSRMKRDGLIDYERDRFTLL